ncbi:MAG: hypothetical protein CUN54_01150 [Phototrophicales bacterium]|nr:MAG: hypothetical protein CUN54_01150 [Phototrophicales bacterium]
MKATFRHYLQDFDFGYLVAALLPLIGILPTLGDGIIETADGPLHIQRISAMITMLGDGNLWPRWVPWFHLGYGYPIFNFYAPGTFYLSGIIGQFGISANTAFVIVTTLAWIVGSVGMYRLARIFLPGRAAILAAMMWAYAPSRLFEVWDQGSMPQMMGAALIPWVFMGAWLVTQQPTRRHVVALALPLAGVVLSHQPMTFITALYVGALVVILSYWAGRQHPGTLRKRLLYSFGGLCLAGGLTAIFLLPVAAELQYVQASRGAEDTVEFLRSQFLSAEELFMQPPVIDLADIRYELPTTLGPMAGLLGLVGISALLRKRHFAIAALLTAGIFFTLFMLTEISITVWTEIPFFQQLRFPERFLRAGVVVFALAGGASLLLIPRRWQALWLAGSMTAVLLSAAPLMYPIQAPLTIEANNPLDEILWEEDERVWGTTSYDEFDPIWGEHIPLVRVAESSVYRDNPYSIVVRPTDILEQWPDLQAEQIAAKTTRIQTTSARPVRFHQYYFPGWKAWLDGEPTEVYGEDEFGLLTVDVPAGEHTVTLNYAGTTAQRAGTAMTLLSLGIVALLIISGRPMPQQPATQQKLESRWGIAIAGAVALLALVNALYISPNTTLFRRQSPPDSPVGMAHEVNVPFRMGDDEIMLLGYTIEQESVKPGEKLDITLFWRAQNVIEGRYRSRVQLVNLSVSEAWAVSEPPVPGGGNTNGHAPDKYFSDPHQLHVFETAQPYVGRIMVQMVEKYDGIPLLLPDGSDRLILDTIIRIEGDSEAVSTRVDYQFANQLSLQCISSVYDDGVLQVDLFWHVQNSPEHDYVAFIHALDADGAIVTQFDGPPLNGDYPTSFWREGQSLADHYTLATDEPIDSIGIGLYLPDTLERLSVTHDGVPVQDNRIILPIAEQSCVP